MRTLALFSVLALSSGGFVGTAAASDRFIDVALYDCAESGTTWLANILLLLGADPNSKRLEVGATPLMAAASAGRAESVALLLEHGGNPKVADRQGATALTMAASNLALVKMLVEKGADIDAQINMGGRKQLTALMIAAQSGAKDVVQYLLERGADPTIKTSSEKTARDIAESNKFDDIAKLLAEAMAKRSPPPEQPAAASPH